MQDIKLINFLNSIIAITPVAFYPLAIISLVYSAAFLLFCYNPKNRNILILLSIPIIVSIIGIFINSYSQVCGIITNNNALKVFTLCNALLIIGGFIANFQVKYMFVSHCISSILHVCFYFSIYHYEVARVLATVYTPILSYFTLLSITYFILSHFSLKVPHGIDLIKMQFMDCFLPTNESRSHAMIILLQSYMMINHINFIYFLKKWFDYSLLSFSAVFLIIVFQFILVTIWLQIMIKCPSSANVPFYVSANLMIIKVLIDQVIQNYKIYRSNEVGRFYLQWQYFSNRLMYFSLGLVVVFIFNGCIAYASDEELGSPTVEGTSAGRYLRTGGTFAGGAVSYEMVSIAREAWENRGESGEQSAILNDTVQDCIAAKNTLNTINYKLKSEFALIQEVEIYLDMVQENAEGADVEDLRKYVEKIEQYTTNLQAKYITYEQYKSKVTDRMYRWFCGVNSCSCSDRVVKES